MNDEAALGMLITTFAMISAFFVAIACLKCYFAYWERRTIPHIPPVIVRGNMADWMNTKHCADIYAETYDKFKDSDFVFAGFFLNTQRAVIALNLRFIEQVLKKHCNAFDHRHFFCNEKSDPFTGNLLLLNGPKWAALRQMLHPTFAPCKIKYIFPTMRVVTDALRNVFRQNISTNYLGVFDVQIILRQFALDIIANCVYGLDQNSMENPQLMFSIMARKLSQYRENYNSLDRLIHSFPDWARRLRLRAISKEITDYFMNLTENIIEARKTTKAKNPNYLDVLVEHNKNSSNVLSTKELAAQLFVFFMTAVDTGASTLSCALYELARHPQVQRKLREQINGAARNHKNELTYQYLMNNKYLDHVISETLRRYPVMPALYRKCTKSFIPFNREMFRVPKGCLVIVPILSIHHNPAYFPNPFVFDPDRFSDPKNIKPYSYLPFGAGKRKCIGEDFGRLQARLALAELIRNYKFDICARSNVPLEFSIETFNINPASNILKVSRA